MKEYVYIGTKLTRVFADVLDSLVATGEFSSRAELIRYCIQKTLIREGRIAEIPKVIEQ